jgi:hypothetical protein
MLPEQPCDRVEAPTPLHPQSGRLVDKSWLSLSEFLVLLTGDVPARFSGLLDLTLPESR